MMKKKNMRFKVIVNYISRKIIIKLNEWNYNRSSRNLSMILLKHHHHPIIIPCLLHPPSPPPKNYFPPDISRALYNEARRQ